MDALAFVASSQREAIINSRELISLDERINAVLALQETITPKKICKPFSKITSLDINHDISDMYCYGLPYQDHNYGAPMPKLNDDINNLKILADSLNTVPYIKTPEKSIILKQPVKRQENDDSITRCICGFKHDDGYMICCDKCSVWQHVDCMQLDKKNIPDEYLCDNCHPRSLNKQRAIQLQKKKLLIIGSGPSPNDSSTETEDETQTHIGLDDMTEASLLNGSTNYPINGKKRIKRRLKRKDIDPETSNVRSNSMKKHGKFTKKIQNKTKKFDKIKSSIKKSPKSKISKYRMQQDTYEEAQSNSYTNDTNNLDLPDIRDYICVKQLDLSGPLCRVAIVNDNIKGLNLIRSVRSNEIIIEYKGKVMFEKSYHLLPAKERKTGFVLYYKPNELSLCINTSIYANDARFIRRSCTPNSKVKHTFENGIIRFFIYASEIIENTTELTIPFDHKSYESMCACNSNYCLVKKVPLSPIRKARTRSLSIFDSKITTPKKQKDVIKSVKSPDDQQAIDALLRLSHGVVSQKSTIDDIIHVSECKDEMNSEIIANNCEKNIAVDDIKIQLFKSDEKEDLLKIHPVKIKESVKEEKKEVSIIKEIEKIDIQSIKDNKPVKEIKEHKPLKEIKEHKPLKEIKEHKPLKEIKESKSHKEIKESKSHKEIKEHKPQKEIKESKSHKEIKEHKQQKEIKEHKPQKEIKELKSHKEIKENKSQKEIKEHKSIKEIKEHKSQKEIKDNKSQKEIKTKPISSKIVKSPPLQLVHDLSIRRKRRSRLSSENKRSISTEVASSSADENSDSEKIEEHKLTREERKIQAIVKQFEQMENKIQKHKNSPRISSRKVSKEVIDSIQEYKPDNKTRHKHKRKKSRRQSTNSISVSPSREASDHESFSPKEELVKNKKSTNEWAIGNNNPIENNTNESISFTSNTAGSAKKRWLRQAMIERNDITKDFKSIESITETVESFITPLKKRRIPSESHSPMSVPSTIEIQLPETPPTTDDNKPSLEDGELNSDHEEKTVLISSTSISTPITSTAPSEHVRKKVSLDEYRKRIRTNSVSSTTSNKPSISAVFKKSTIGNSVDNSLNLSSIRLRAEIEFDHISGDADNENLQYYKAYNQYQEPRYHNQDRAWQQHLSQRRLSTSAASNASYQTERPPC